MHGPAHNLAALAVCFCLILLSGCAQTFDSTTNFLSSPWKKKPEELLNVKTPDDRVKELKELAKAAKKKTPEEQQRSSDELAKEIQKESDPMLRRQILRTLAEFPTPVALNVLKAGLRDGDADVRVVACQSLGKRGGKEAVQELSGIVGSDTNLDVRIAAVRAMGQTKDATATSVLGDVLADPDPALQYRAKESLRLVSGRDYGDDVQAWRQYAKTGQSDAPEISLTARVRRYFY